MNLVELSDGLAEVMRGAGCEVYDYVPGSVELPCATVGWPDELVYNQNFALATDIEVPIYVLVSRADAEDARRRLDAAASTVDVPGAAQQSIVRRVNGAAGPWKRCTVRRVDGFGSYEVSGQASAVGFIVHASIRSQ